MRGALSCAIVAVLFLLPTAVAPPPQQAQGGLTNACNNASSNQPCILAGVIQSGTIGPGQSQTYQNGEWTVDGTITVEPGGSLTLNNAIFQFTANSHGIVSNGGVVKIIDSLLEPHSESSPYKIDIGPGTNFTLNDTSIYRGQGVRLASSIANVSGNSLQEIALALFLDSVSVNIHHNQFLDNNVSINQTGGANTLANNLFDGGEVCVRDWLTDPVITQNTFRGCHVGILHQNSASTFSLNDMEDEAAPPGTGIIVENTNSPVIEGNRIANYGTGIIVRNATAYIRNNEIVNNVGDGVRVEENTQPMDIQNNTIAWNGDDGIELIGAVDVFVNNNSISENGGDGVVVTSSSGIAIENTTASANGANGFQLLSSSVNATDVTATSNAGHGIVVAGFGSRMLVRANASANTLDGFHASGSPPAAAAGGFTTLTQPRAIGNGGDGLNQTSGNAASASLAWWEGNGGAGVINHEPDVTLNTECAYWGSDDGPTTPDNPEGTGDEVVGTVDWSPYRSSPALTACQVPEYYFVG